MIKSLIYKNKIKLNNNPHLKEIIFGSAYTIVIKIFGMILGLGVTFLISKIYGAEGIGLYNLSVRTIIILSIVSTLGINTSILRYVGQFNKKGHEHKLKQLYKLSIQIVLPTSILIGIALFISSDMIANNLFDNINYKEPLKLLSIILPFLVILNISVEYIRGLKSIKISESLRSVTRPTINIIFLIIISSFTSSYLVPYFTFSGVLIHS